MTRKMRHTTYGILHTAYNSGFSIIEMLVTISIIAIISSIVLISFPTFASTIVLENLTHEIALVVRQAQVYGIGIKQSQQALGGDFPSYGAHFDTSTDESQKQVIFFADVDGDGIYSAGEEVETFLIQRGNTISGLCYEHASTSADCTNTQNDTNVIDITFTRPNPTAHININADSLKVDRDSAKITVSPPDGSEIGDRFIYVSLTGQIAVTSE